MEETLHCCVHVVMFLGAVEFLMSGLEDWIFRRFIPRRRARFKLYLSGVLMWRFVCLMVFEG